MSKKHTYEYVKEEYKKYGCELLDDNYENNHTAMQFKCSCGKVDFIRYDNLKNGQRCGECGNQKRTKSKYKYSYESVKQVFESRGCVLLENKYIGIHEKMKYKCSCGNPSETTFNSFKRDHGCQKCGAQKKADHFRLKYDVVFNFFNQYGCKLLETEYINSGSILKYLCTCGREATRTFDGFKISQRCRECRKENGKGENSHSWKGGITPLHNYLRYQIKHWKKDSLVNGNYQCLLTGTKKNIEVHHLYPFNKIIKQTIESLDIPVYGMIAEYSEDELDFITKTFLDIHNRYGLGVAIAKGLHKKFHLDYGKTDFTAEQFEEFKIRYNNGEFDVMLTGA